MVNAGKAGIQLEFDVFLLSLWVVLDACFVGPVSAVDFLATRGADGGITSICKTSLPLAEP